MTESRFIYPVGNALQRMTLRLFADWKVTGRENVPPMGPLIIVSNHQSNFDPPLLGASIPRRMRFLAKDSIFVGPGAHWFLTSYGAFPLNRGSGDVRAYRWVLGQLDKGQAVVVLPEGTRSRGGLSKANSGVARLALRSGAPLLPVGITGTERFGTWKRVFNPTGKIRVNIGQVFSLPSIDGQPSKEVLESLTELVMHRIAALLPESYQGAYRLAPEKSPAAQDAL